MSRGLAVTALSRSGALAIAMCVANSVAEAQFFQNNFGLADPASTITFSEQIFADDALITNQFSGQGLTVSSGSYYVPAFLGSIGAGITGDHLRNFSNFGADIINPVALRFGTTQTAVALGVATNARVTLFEAYLNGSFVTSASAETGILVSSAYYGFSGISFNEIRLTSTVINHTGGGAEQYLTLDNVQLNNVVTVPEPTSLALLVTACTLLMGRAARWRPTLLCNSRCVPASGLHG